MSIGNQTLQAAVGQQTLLYLTKVPAGVSREMMQKSLLEVGQLSVAGDYEAAFEVGGVSDIEVHLMPSQVAGAFAPTLVTTYANGGKTKGSAAGANFAAGVLQSLTLSGIKGVKKAIVKFTIPGGGSVTFAPGSDPGGAAPAAQAEWSGF